ncbi:MAG: MerR family transcriptional regulator, partial [Eubacterium sp.]
MKYTVKTLADLAGVSVRTLRYYDEIGLLRPEYVDTSGYRIYEQAQIDELQQILFYKEMGISLEEINKMVHSDDFDHLAALKEHRQQLEKKQEQLKKLLNNVNKTIKAEEGNSKINDKEKFEGFITDKINQNEQEYGKEIR